MSFEWQHFLDLAEALVKQQADPESVATGEEAPGSANASDAPSQSALPALQEAALRTAVSRAYYAAYHIVREYMRVRLSYPMSPLKTSDGIDFA